MRAEEKEQFRFQGNLEVGSGQTTPAILTIEYHPLDPTSLDVGLYIPGTKDELKSVHSYLRKPANRNLTFHSDDKQNTPIEIHGVHYFQFSSEDDYRFVSIKALAVLIGVSKAPLDKDTAWLFFVELVPSGILIKPGVIQPSFTGDITFTPVFEGEVTVSTSFGVFEVAESYLHYESDQYGNKITHRVQRASIRGTIQVPQGDDFYSATESLLKEVVDICNVLSLCYRQPVTYYEIKYIAKTENFRTSIYREKRNTIEKKIAQDDLITLRDMLQGGFDLITQTYKNSKRKEEISRAIQFLASSYRVVTLESSYFLAYSALDLITSGDNFLLGASKWEKVKKSVRSHLNSIAEKEGITSVLEEIKEKVSELRRVSGKTRISTVCKNLGVYTDDLWPREGFEKGLKMATDMRDELFHAALCSDRINLQHHTIRVRILVERILLKILEWPDEKIGDCYDQNLRRISYSGKADP